MVGAFRSLFQLVHPGLDSRLGLEHRSPGLLELVQGRKGRLERLFVHPGSVGKPGHEMLHRMGGQDNRITRAYVFNDPWQDGERASGD